VPLTVTATQGGSAFQGLGLQVKVLTGAEPAASQAGGTGTAAGSAANQVSVTTTQTGSYVYVALSEGEPATAAAGCTILGSYSDAVNGGEWYGAIRTVSATGTPGAVTVGGNLTSGASFVDIAAAEILAATSIAEDASSPVYAATSTATAITTASFSPPAGSLLVAIVASDGAADGVSDTTMSVADTMSLTWTPLAQAADPSTCYAGIFVADVPAAAGTVPPARNTGGAPVIVVARTGWRGANHSR